MTRLPADLLLVATFVATLALPACARRAHEAPSARPPSAPAPALQPQATEEEPATSRSLASLPAPPDATPSPWVEYAVERGMGAECNEGPFAGSMRTSYLTQPACRGPMPRHLAEVLLQLPANGLFLSMQQRLDAVSKPVVYRAVAGVGRRPDFLAENHPWAIRSFEGLTEADTVFWLEGPTRCSDDNRGETRYEPVPECERPYRQVALFRRTVEGTLVDVTESVGFDQPVLEAADAKLVNDHTGSGPSPDVWNLQRVPVLRWTSELDPDNPAPIGHPRSFQFGHRLHFGFDVWDGTRFVRREKVSRDQWPCTPGEDAAVCRNDRFIIDSTTTTQRKQQ